MAAKLTKAELWRRLADNRVARYPEMYRGHEADALYFASHQYPTKADAELACYCLGISVEA